MEFEIIIAFNLFLCFECALEADLVRGSRNAVPKWWTWQPLKVFKTEQELSLGIHNCFTVEMTAIFHIGRM